MSWTCTAEQSKTLSAIVRGARERYCIEYDTAGRDYGTPDDLMIPVELLAIVGTSARELGRAYIAPDGTIPGADLACRTARDLKTIGDAQK